MKWIRHRVAEWILQAAVAVEVALSSSEAENVVAESIAVTVMSSLSTSYLEGTGGRGRVGGGPGQGGKLAAGIVMLMSTGVESTSKQDRVVS